MGRWIRLWWTTALAAGGAWGGWPPGDTYLFEDELDDEYGLDLAWAAYDRDWHKAWDDADRGLRVAMGSLNVRQWYLDQEVKLAAEAGRARFLYRYWRHEGLEPLYDERQRNEMEIEGRVVGPLRVGLRLEPTFWKRYADGGVSARWVPDRNHTLYVGYTALDFDNNYSFERSKLNEGYEEKYHIPPRRFEVAGRWQRPSGAGVTAEAFLRTPSLKHYRYFRHQLPDGARRFAENHVAARFYLPAEARWGGDVVWERDRWEETRRLFDQAPASPPAYDDYDADLSLDAGAITAYYQPSLHNRLRLGGGLRHQTRYVHYTQLPYDGYGFVKTEYYWLGLWRRGLGRGVFLETGYMGEVISSRRLNLGNNYAEAGRRRENRLPISLEYRAGPRLWAKIASGLDLDRQDWGAYLFYDKGYAFLTATF